MSGHKKIFQSQFKQTPPPPILSKSSLPPNQVIQIRKKRNGWKAFAISQSTIKCNYAMITENVPTKQRDPWDSFFEEYRGLATNEYSSSMILCLSKICCVVPAAAAATGLKGELEGASIEKWDGAYILLLTFFWIEYNMCEPSSPTLCD